MEWLLTLLRNRVARFAAFVLLPVLGMLWWELDGAPGEVVGEATAHGVVAEVHQRAYLVTLEEGEQVRVFRTRKLAVGDAVDLLARHYDSGLTQYELRGDAAR